MSSTLPIWLFIALLVAVAALIAFSPRLDAAKLALLSRQRLVILPAAAFLLVAGIGAATSYWGDHPKGSGAGATHLNSGSDVEVLADYTRSLGPQEPAHAAPSGKPLPDVNTMIERLAARLKTTPNDIKGWRMLGWSYFHTGRYEEAATALARAVELDPNSAELKSAYEKAKAKAAGGDDLETASSSQGETTSERGGGPAGAYDAAIRSMVDGLAARLEKSPRDAEGWTRLMRSRVVLGEREVAATAFRQALEVFKDDSVATGKITAAAIELGLKAE